VTVYSYAQLESLWINAGGPKALAPLAAAIGEAESGGNSDALNPTDNNGTQSSFGIWQISNGTHTPPNPNWANPAVNAQLAVAKWRGAGQNFSPWGTYDSGAYRAYLSNSTSPDPSVPGSATALAAQATAAGSADCLVGGDHIGILFGAGPTLPCLFTRSNARAFLGAGLLVGGGLVALAGGGGFGGGGGDARGRAVGEGGGGGGGALMLVPGAEGAGAGLVAAGKGAKAVGKGRAPSRRRSADEELQKRMGEPKLNPDLEVHGGVIREDAEQKTARKRREQGAARSRARRAVTPSAGGPASREETGF